MKAVDRIRAYIRQNLAGGVFRPGTRLPGYLELAEQFGLSYLTVSTSLKKLAAEGLVEIRNGTGTYISGGAPLTVLVNFKSSTLPHPEMRQLLEKYTRNTDLHLEFELAEADDLPIPAVRIRRQADYKAAVSILPARESICELLPAQLTQFDGFHSTLAQLHTRPGRDYDSALPFTGIAARMGVNTRLLARLGFIPATLPNPLARWDELRELARKHHIELCNCSLLPQLATLFSHTAGVLLAQAPYSEELYHGRTPLFRSEAGHRFFRIVKELRNVPEGSPENFFLGGALFCFHLPSWIISQNFSPAHPEKRIPEFAFLPCRTPDGRKICELSFDCLKAFLRHDLTLNERSRVWALMKIMISREFQLEFCARTGMISARRDIFPADYSWNRDGRWNMLFPGPDTFEYTPDALFNPEQLYQLSLLLENYCFYHASEEETAFRMDQKKIPFSFFHSGLN